jgi:hypothetical protein
MSTAAFSGKGLFRPLNESAGSLCLQNNRRKMRYETMSTSTLMWGIIFGSIGLALFVYGKKQKAFVPLFSGIGLMVAPYFISNIYFLVLSGIVLTALPFILK